MKLIKDLFKNPGNLAWDLARFIATGGGLLMVAAQAWNMHLGLPIELGPTGLGGGLGAVMAGQAALIFAKDKAGAEARLTQAVTHNIEQEPPKPSPKAKRR